MTYKSALKYSDITPKTDFLNRRQLMGGLGAAAVGALAGPGVCAGKYSSDETPNSLEDITAYNNFYEFGTGKGDPAKYAHRMTIDPWAVQIDGLVDKPGNYGLGDILAKMTIEERIYRFRCVEAWSWWCHGTVLSWRT